MKIFVNKQHQIKAINSIGDSEKHLIESGLLREIDVDRQLVFKDMSDYMILSYCYREDEFDYSVYPAYNYDSILTRDNYLKISGITEKISLLTQENETQEEVIANLTYELMIMQVMQVNEKTSINKSTVGISPKYNMIKKWYGKGYWTSEMVLKALECDQITQDEYNDIIAGLDK